MSRALAILLAVLAAAVLAACGSDDPDTSADASELLAEAFGAPVESGKMTLDAELRLDGVPGLGDGIDIRMSGPFTKTEIDLDVSVGGFLPGLAGGLTVTEDNLYISVAGRSYELGEDAYRDIIRDTERETGKDYRSLSFEDLGLDIQSWLTDARVEGDEEVAGEPVTRISAGIDAEKLLADLNEFAGTTGTDAPMSEDDLDAMAGFAEDSKLELYVSKADSTIRRVALELEFEVPEDARGDFGGVEGGAASIDVTLTDIGEPQRIEPPADARPLDDLLRQFGLGPELFQQ